MSCYSLPSWQNDRREFPVAPEQVIIEKLTNIAIAFMKLRSFFLVLASFVLITLLVAGGAFYWIIAQSPIKSLSLGRVTDPTAALFIPRQSPVVLSLLANPDRIEAFSEIAVPLRQRGRDRRRFDRLKTSLLSNRNINYEQDIQPWLGEEVTFALTSPDYDRNPENGSQLGYIVVASSRDPDAAREFLQRLYSRDAIASESELTFETYKGVKLIYRRNTAENRYTSASAVIGDRFVIFANHPKVLRSALNNVQAANLSLESAPGYQKALNIIKSPRIGVGVVNLPALAAWIAKTPLPPELEQTLTLSLNADRQGLVAETALAGLLSDTTVPPTLSSPVPALDYIPQSAILSAAGSDLEQLWEQVAESLTPQNGFAPLIDQGIVSLNENLGIDVTQEIFSWTEGEYALALLPNSQWLFVAENTTPETEDAIAHLDTLAEDQGLSLNQITIGDRPITVWTKLSPTTQNGIPDLQTEVKGVHTTIGNYELFSNNLGGLELVFQDQDPSILDKPDFRDAIAQLPKNNNGYLYIDWPQTQPFIDRNIPLFRLIEFVGKPVFDSLHSFTLSSRGRENGINRASIFFDVKD